MSRYPEKIVCCYLYIISKYGYPPPAEKTLQHLEEMAVLGFQSVELEGIREAHLLQVYALRHEIQAKVRALNLQVPYFCIVLPGLSSEDVNERQKNLDLFARGCEIAALLDAQGVLDNGPLPPWRFPEDIPITRHYDQDVLAKASLPEELSWPVYWKDLIATYREACEIAAAHQLTYHMHPANGVLTATAAGYLHFSRAIDRPNLRCNFDTANQYYMHDNLQLSLKQLTKEIDYIHISDTSHSHHAHLQPGEGEIDWQAFMRTLRENDFDGYFGIDIGGAESSVVDLVAAYRATADWLIAQGVPR